MQTRRRTVLTLLSALALSACGFQLRGSGTGAIMPFKFVHIGLPENSPLGIELRRYLRASDISVPSDPKAAEAILEILTEARDKAVLSINTQGRIREHTLYYRVRFRVKNPQEQELLPATDIVLKRDISFNEAQVIAKEKEEEMLFRDMQSDAVQQILRRMAAIKPAQ